MSRWRRDEGAAMVMVIIVSLAGSMLVASGLRLTEVSGKPARQMPGKAQALLTASAGARKAEMQITYDVVALGVDSISGSFGGGTYKAVTFDHGDSSYTIVATGKVGGYERTIEVDTEKVRLSLDNIILSGVGAAVDDPDYAQFEFIDAALINGNNTTPPGYTPNSDWQRHARVCLWRLGRRGRPSHNRTRRSWMISPAQQGTRRTR